VENASLDFPEISSMEDAISVSEETPQAITEDIRMEESGGVVYPVKDTDNSYLLSGNNDNSDMLSMLSDEVTLPSSYNNDITDLKYVSPVKNQRNLGVCWDFASTSLMETLLMKTNNKEKLTTEADKADYDFSELHAAHAISNSFKKDGIYGYTRNYNAGGNIQYFTSYLTSNSYVKSDDTAYESSKNNFYSMNMSESILPYDSYYSYSSENNDICENMGRERAGYFPDEACYFSFKSKLDSAELENRNNSIKKALLESGSVYASIYCGASTSSSSKGFLKSGDDYLFYYNIPGKSSHAVAIVGYDDSYPASNFSGFSSALTEDESSYPAAPTNNGAFIVKNSWGSSWGNNGYFYMSYDSAMREIAIINDMDSKDNYDNLYEYTSFYPLSGSGYASSGTFKFYGTAANLFTAKTAEDTTKSENIKKILIWARGDVYVRLFADLDASDGEFNKTEYIDPDDLFLTSSTEKEVIDDIEYIHIPASGQYIFTLKTPLKINDIKFTVGAEYSTKSDGVCVPIVSYYDDSSDKPYKCELTPNVSFLTTKKSSLNINDPAADFNIPIKVCTEEFDDPDKVMKNIVDVTINDTIVPVSRTVPFEKAYPSSSDFYILVGDNTYKIFDKSTAAKPGMVLCTADYLCVPDIVCKQFQWAQGDNSSTWYKRYIGEIDPTSISENLKTVTDIGFAHVPSIVLTYDSTDKYYSTTSGYLAKNAKNYTKSNENNYLFFFRTYTTSESAAKAIPSYKPYIKYELIDGRKV
ncbi:MAG: hypothetical protein IJ736_10620, partial [Firmicutes bacterium]|nr:hypothetical protein [Bacillota bacterium]